MVDYTIAVCNYNMSSTIERSLRSILDQLDDRFEVLVVDDGSTDNSVNIVQNLCEEYDALRLLALPPDPGRHLGETRNISVRNARGEHVLVQLDADDVYGPIIKDFVKIYETIRETKTDDFLFKGNSLTVAPREFLIQHGPYRNLPVGAEDLDMWRRLLAFDSIVWLEHNSPVTEIARTERSILTVLSGMRRGIRVRTGEFQTGISPKSRLTWRINQYKREEVPLREILFELVATPYSFLRSLVRPRYDLPEQFKDKEALKIAKSSHSGSLGELESWIGFSVDRSELSEAGREIFDLAESQDI